MLMLALVLFASDGQSKLDQAYADALVSVYIASTCFSDPTIGGRLRSRIEQVKTHAIERGYADAIKRGEAMYQGDLAESLYLCIADTSLSTADVARQSVENLEATVTGIPTHHR